MYCIQTDELTAEFVLSVRIGDRLNFIPRVTIRPTDETREWNHGYPTIRGDTAICVTVDNVYTIETEISTVYRIYVKNLDKTVAYAQRYMLFIAVCIKHSQKWIYKLRQVAVDYHIREPVCEKLVHLHRDSISVMRCSVFTAAIRAESIRRGTYI